MKTYTVLKDSCNYVLDFSITVQYSGNSTVFGVKNLNSISALPLSGELTLRQV